MFTGSNAFPGVLTSTGSNIQVFLGSEVVTSKGSYLWEFLHPNALTSRVSYIQRFFHSGLVRDFIDRGLPSY